MSITKYLIVGALVMVFLVGAMLIFTHKQVTTEIISIPAKIIGDGSTILRCTMDGSNANIQATSQPDPNQ